MTTRLLLVLAIALCSSVVPSAQAPAPTPLLGFTSARADAQRQLESRFDAAVNADNLREWLKRLAARPHHVGSPYGKDNAEFMASLFRLWGYDVALEEYQVLLPTPLVRQLELVAPTKFVAALSEPAIKEDATSGQTAEQLPVYNAYSIDGDVTGELVFVNYGVPADYDELELHGIDVKGKIVIAKYGGSWRGIKPKVAAEHGAIGCLIYSDPREDGYFQGDVYPAGGWRSDRSAQRGSVADMPTYPGDPLTPGVGATKSAKRPANYRDAETLTKIPVLPISYADALPLLKAIGGPMAPERWRGALPLPYRLGPGPARVHLKLQFDWKLVPAFDVVARMTGSELPDEWIVRGNHHDGWVNGATDPVSGMVVLLEEARVLGELARTGFRPKRTIVYAGWDGEEQGLLGSTEWAEDHADELKRKAVVYINSDGNSAGFLQAGGSHTLERFVNEVAADVAQPKKTGLTVAARLRAYAIENGTADDRALARGDGLFALDALGSGSDFTPFLQHLGIASLNIGFGGEADYGQYHSIYDSIDHYLRFGDPDFSHGVALAKIAGRIVLRLSEAEVLPFEFGRFSSTVSKYVTELDKLAETMRGDTEERNKRIEEGTYVAVADPRQTYKVPAPFAPVPYLNFAPLRNALARIKAAATKYDKAVTTTISAGRVLPAASRGELDRLLMSMEQTLTREGGLPKRPWFTHHVYAPGYYTGYGVKTLPAVREAIEQRQWNDVAAGVDATAAALDAFGAQLETAAATITR